MSKQLLFSKCLVTVTAIACVVVSSTSVVIAHEGEDHDAKPMQPALSAQGKRVVKALNSYAAAVQASDIDAVEKYVVTNAGFTSLEGASMDSGWDAARKHMASEMPMLKNMSYSFSNINPFVRGELAYTTLDYDMGFTIENDQFEGGKHEIKMKGKATMVLLKSKNEWKIRHIHTVRKEDKNPSPESNPH